MAFHQGYAGGYADVSIVANTSALVGYEWGVRFRHSDGRIRFATGGDTTKVTADV